MLFVLNLVQRPEQSTWKRLSKQVNIIIIITGMRSELYDGVSNVKVFGCKFQFCTSHVNTKHRSKVVRNRVKPKMADILWGSGVSFA